MDGCTAANLEDTSNVRQVTGSAPATKAILLQTTCGRTTRVLLLRGNGTIETSHGTPVQLAGMFREGSVRETANGED
jgi:hypothetical protein